MEGNQIIYEEGKKYGRDDRDLRYASIDCMRMEEEVFNFKVSLPLRERVANQWHEDEMGISHWQVSGKILFPVSIKALEK